jgi:hypothetical protein
MAINVNASPGGLRTRRPPTLSALRSTDQWVIVGAALMGAPALIGFFTFVRGVGCCDRHYATRHGIAVSVML